MSVVLFIVILFVLVLVHELGHFLVAKKFGVRVDEFGFGYPPRAARLFKKGETEYTLNWLPFGGFVKIFGEDPNDESANGPDSGRALVNKPRYQQALVLVAGVVCNWLLAWILLSVGFMSGLPAAISSDSSKDQHIKDVSFRITQVVKGSPADTAGIKTGDVILGAHRDDGVDLIEKTPEGLISFVSTSKEGERLTFTVERNHEQKTIDILPKKGVVADKVAIGVASDTIGVLKLPFFQAFHEGATMAWNMTAGTASSMYHLIVDSFKGHADISSLSGPVGIVGIVGDAYKFGFAYLMSFTALISINLAIINLIPFPALDGGRLLFILIEKIKGSRISSNVANWLNTIGFFILIALMLVVTYHDVVKLIK